MNQRSANFSKLDKVRKLLDKRQQLDEALSLCNELLHEQVSYEIYNERTYVFEGLGRREEALQDLQRMIELKPDASNAYFQRALWAIADGRFLDSLDDLVCVIERGEAYFLEDAYFYRAVALLNLDKRMEAMQDCLQLSADYSMHVRSPGRIRGILSRDDLIALASE